MIAHRTTTTTTTTSVSGYKTSGVSPGLLLGRTLSRRTNCVVWSTPPPPTTATSVPEGMENEEGVVRRGWQYVTQSVNLRGVGDFVSLYARTCGGDGSRKDVHVPILPHIETSDLRNIDWVDLKETKKYKGVVFDKDHTLTLPYDMKLHPFARESLEQCIAVFGKENVVLYSNSAGLKQFDPEGHHAAVLEDALGISVFRHEDKKPHVSSRTVQELQDYFGCETRNLIMVGDRYMTDVVFGNRLGMLTIRPTPFAETSGSRHREPLTVRISRRLEEGLVNRCRSQGMCPPSRVVLRE